MSATIWINGQPAGDHSRKGYTAFTLDITPFLRWGETNAVAVRVDNAFNDHILPRGRSSDWAHDGGIYRPVQLLVTPKTFVERVDVEAIPDFTSKEGKLTITAYARNSSSKRWNGRAWFEVFDEETGLVVLTSEISGFSIETRAAQTMSLHAVLPHAKLWHFDHPNLYRLDFSIADEHESHQFTTTFGVRKLEVKKSEVDRFGWFGLAAVILLALLASVLGTSLLKKSADDNKLPNNVVLLVKWLLARVLTVLVLLGCRHFREDWQFFLLRIHH